MSICLACKNSGEAAEMVSLSRISGDKKH